VSAPASGGGSTGGGADTGSGGSSIEALLDALTLEEQIGLLAGGDFWHTVPVERLGIPAMRVSDGPVGARGTTFAGGPPSMCAPCGTLLAATWDPALVEQVGQVLGRETKAKGASVLLAPTVNLHRTPVGGRNFECLSEDPWLSARMAVGYVRGVQSQGVACCIKHFVGNDTEFERMSVDSRIDERTLREVYLVPFEAAVTEAGVQAIMTAYNRINGVWSADSAENLALARDEWGYDGLFMSDWFGLHSTVEGIEAGLDLEMPGPTLHRGAKLLEAVESGLVAPAAVRRAAGNVLRLMARTGALHGDGPGPETSRTDGPEAEADLALLRRTAAAGMVLVHNPAHTLPLAAGELRRVAVVGPNAAVGQVMGGGSAHVTPTRVAHPLASLQARLGSLGVEVVHAAGAYIHRRLPEPEPAVRTGPGTLAIYASPDDLDRPGAEPVSSSALDGFHMMWVADPTGRRDPNPSFGARLAATVVPDRTGEWHVGVESVAPATVLVNGRQILDNTDTPVGGSFFGTGRGETRASVELTAGQPVELVVEIRHRPNGMGMGGFNLGLLGPLDDDPIGLAEAAAAGADATIVVVGTNDDWECEGWDRTTLALPGSQDELVRRVAAASRRTIVVVNSGSPVLMPWLADVDAALLCWFPGQEMGEALADVLLGDVEPGGRLPVTFPASLDDTPTVEHYPGRNGVAEYREGRLLGHRWYDTVGREPLFPFGFGLGYAEVDVTAAQRGTGAEAGTVTATVANRSTRAGSQVVQVYLAPTGDRSGDEPAQRLVGFARVTVPAGSEAEVAVTLDPRATLTWDVAGRTWVEAPGPFELRVGTSSRHLPIRLPLL